MAETHKSKNEIRNNAVNLIKSFSENDLLEKYNTIEENLFSFSNFLEAQIILLYMNAECEVNTKAIINRCFDYGKVVVLPTHDVKKNEIKLFKVNNIKSGLIKSGRGVLEPRPRKDKIVPINRIDIAIIPGIAFDEKGGRIGLGIGYYEKLIPKLPITTRKVALGIEEQIIQQVPVESKNRHVDIIITNKRIIYKI